MGVEYPQSKYPKSRRYVNMKKKFVLALLCLFLISACMPVRSGQTPQAMAVTSIPTQIPTQEVQKVLTDDEALQIRKETIKIAAAELEKNPGLWEKAPQPCFKGMVKVYVSEGGFKTFGGSGSLIQKEKLTNELGGVVWVYSIITVNHLFYDQNGNFMEGDIYLFPGSYSGYRYQFSEWEFRQFTDEHGLKQDSGLLTVMGYGIQSEIDDPNFVPLGTTNIVPFDGEDYGSQFFIFDYPDSGKPQFSESEFIGNGSFIDGNIVQVLKPLDNSGTVTHGSSGGAVCSNNGQHLGVVTGHGGNWPTNFLIEGNTSTITQQINESIADSRILLSKNGYVYED